MMILKEAERLGIPVRRVSGEKIMGHCKIRRNLCRRKRLTPNLQERSAGVFYD